jgi:hypothetical protein
MKEWGDERANPGGHRLSDLRILWLMRLFRVLGKKKLSLRV